MIRILCSWHENAAAVETVILCDSEECNKRAFRLGLMHSQLWECGEWEDVIVDKRENFCEDFVLTFFIVNSNQCT